MEPDVLYRDGPRAGGRDWMGAGRPAVIGDGSDGGVYQRTDDIENGLAVYAWHPLTEAEANAIVRGDLRANQQ